MQSRIETILCLFFLLLLPGFTRAQAGVQFRMLLVNEHTGKVGLLQIDDKTYVDLDRLVEIAHGTIAYQGSRILLTLPGSNTTAPNAVAVPEGAKDFGLTSDFMKAGIEGISQMREWASNLANAIQNGYPVSESWVAGYRARAQSAVAMTSASVSSDADRSGYALLNSEFKFVQEWSNKLLDARKSMDAAKYATSPTALQNDPLSQKIVTCGRFLSQMLVSGSFQDDPSCH